MESIPFVPSGPPAWAVGGVRVIFTEAELAALPVGTVLRDDANDVLEQDGRGWLCPGLVDVYDDSDVCLPALVLWEPKPLS